VNRRRMAALLGVALAAALLAACGDDAQPVETGAPGVGDGDAGADLGSDDLVVSVEVVGAFTTAEMSFQMLPSVVVYGDGTRLSPGAQIAIYPGPALPAVQQDQLSEEDVATIVDAAREAGLDTTDVDYGEPPVADAGDTVVTVTIDGETYTHTATALGLVDEPGGVDLGGSVLTDDQVANRAALAGFVDMVSSIPVGEGELYEAERYRLWVQPAAAVDTGRVDEDNIEPRTVEWTVDDVVLVASDCLPVEGDPAAEVGALLADADTLTRFDDGDTTLAVVARPVLPHEPTCPD
jgi:hypothetical protein